MLFACLLHGKPVPTRTSDLVYPAILFPILGVGIRYAYLVPALTSDPAYLAILFYEPFGPERGC